MRLDNNNLMEWAERYVDNAINAHTLTQIQEQLSADPALAAAWQESVSFFQQLKQMAAHQQAKELLGEVMRAPAVKAPAASNKVIAFFQKYGKTASIAAAFALLTSTITYQIATSTNDMQAKSEFISLKREIQSIKQSQDQIKQSISENDKNATAAQAANVAGTGFAISNDGYLATDYHVVEDAESIYVQTNDGKYHKATLVSFDKLNDIAILKIQTSQFKFGNGDIPYTFSSKQASLAQPIFSIGFPQEDALYTEGYISSKKGLAGDSASYQLELTANPGQSGSPIFDPNGQVIGMLIGKKTYATYAIKMDKILDLVKTVPSEYKIKLADKNSLKSLSRTDQVKKTLDYVCAVKVFK